MLNIVCLNAGNYQGRGSDYVTILHDMVTRNLPDGFAGKFVCFTDDDAASYPASIDVRPLPNPELTGWWHKLSLFRDGLFPDGDRIVYLDLDTLIVGPLDEIVAYDGAFAILRDFYRPDGLQSSVMAWQANTMFPIWEAWIGDGMAELPGGDQAVIEKALYGAPALWQDMFPDEFVSFKQHAVLGIPIGAKVCVFHGEPRPHEITKDWVPKVWRVGGGTSAEMVTVANVSEDQIKWQIRSALLRDKPFLDLAEPHDGVAAICAGGPSLRRDIGWVRHLKKQEAKLFSVNGTFWFLESEGVASDVHVLLDARQENIQFVSRETSAQQIYSTQCHPDVLDAASNLTLYHPYFDGIIDIVGENDKSAMIGGGTTAGLHAVNIAFALGYRKIHMFGFDSSYTDGAGHAYEQALNAKDRILDVEFGDATYKCAPWMVTQAEDFERLMPELVATGAEIFVHGDGLIPAMAEAMSKVAKLSAPDLRAQAILRRLEGVPAPMVAEVGVFAADLSKRLLGARNDLRLFMVDSWTADHAEPFKATKDFHAGLGQSQQDEYYALSKAITSFAKDRATIIRKPSVEAAKDIPDHSLDLVFIDADHSYEGCRADITAYWDKVKPGGYLAGHDYANDDFAFGPMVKRAVDEFAAIMGLDLELGENFCWFLVKPAEQAREAA